MGKRITIKPLTAEAFAPYGNIIDATGDPTVMINQGNCGRYHDLADLTFAQPAGRAAISVFEAKPYALPLRLEMVERHPLGSQAFLPMSQAPFLVIVAPDNAGEPGRPLAFITKPGQGVNYYANIWHGVLTPLKHLQHFAVVDRVGEGTNLEEHWFEQPYIIEEEDQPNIRRGIHYDG